jgi:hypothetical protein
LVEIPPGSRSPAFCSKLLRTSTAQDRAASLNNPSNSTRAEGHEVLRDTSGIAMPDANDFPPSVNPGANYRSDRGIHARRVATTG